MVRAFGTEVQIFEAIFEGDRDHAEQLIRRHSTSSERDNLSTVLTDAIELIVNIQKLVGES
jgi:DNA-binding FadR family transcriptional regulator